MRPRLWHRWLLLSAGLVLLALVALLWAQSRGFEQGLLGYARTLEAARLPAIAERLAGEYREVGSWRRLERQPRRWLRIVRPGEDGPPLPPPPRERGLRAPGSEPRAEPPPGRGPRGGALDLLQRLSLLDADGRLLNGPVPGPDALRWPIELDGVRIGELALMPMPELYESAALDFAKAQRERALWIALPVLLLAVLASWALSRRMLRRLDTLALASRRLAGGDYGVRVGAQGRDELGELASDFDRMAASLQQAQQARDRWIADISHELRTPLTILRGELQALQDGIRPLDGAALGSLLAEAERLSQRIDDLYALALSDSGGLRYRFAEVDLAALVAAVAESRRGLFQQAGLQLSCQTEPDTPPLRGDAARLEQLVENLLGNALRYTDAPGEVRLQLRADAGLARLQCDDSAPGVSTDELPHLLERHFRAGSGEPRVGGAGLGLAICRNIVEAHGGRIEVAASPLGGLRVTVELPVVPST
ncbi:ATP-binding protein [Pseudomarimonas salicorniae]|uniref:histidine kinase n=1 Tax=Pseudomarimonas salicorniae TaxID=2933270 RepID=A0ABT0GMW2_9GAMM|nr:ATP-binding protein [Lysobacter sp. CAU 1642]MCK7595335.1 ATP-binding protein [Lysobacter sp. CAU 1642]